MNVNVWGRVGVAVALVLVCSSASMAVDQGQVDINKANQEAGDIFGFILKVTVRWVFPLMALFCAVYGLARGMKRGEWDFFVICVVAAVVVALTPTVLEKIMGMNFNQVMR
jgi:uncharacterized membrane protein